MHWHKCQAQFWPARSEKMPDCLAIQVHAVLKCHQMQQQAAVGMTSLRRVDPGGFDQIYNHIFCSNYEHGCYNKEELRAYIFFCKPIFFLQYWLLGYKIIQYRERRCFYKEIKK